MKLAAGRLAPLSRLRNPNVRRVADIAPAPNTFGVPIRAPFPSEDEYFKANPNVAGMAAEDDNIILNPYSKLSTAEKNAVLMNEAARVYMRTGKVEPPGFDLTPEQEEAFKNYSSAPEDRKATVAARILSGDPSAKNATPDQVAYVKKLRAAMRGKK